jgi:hypothetical protein
MSKLFLIRVEDDGVETLREEIGGRVVGHRSSKAYLGRVLEYGKAYLVVEQDVGVGLPAVTDVVVEDSPLQGLRVLP